MEVFVTLLLALATLLGVVATKFRGYWPIAAAAGNSIGLLLVGFGVGVFAVRTDAGLVETGGTAAWLGGFAVLITVYVLRKVHEGARRK